MGPLTPLLWTSGDHLPWVSKPRWIPRLRAFSPARNAKKTYFLCEATFMHTRPSSHGQIWFKLYARPPFGTKHMCPCRGRFLQTNSPCCLAQHLPSPQSSSHEHFAPEVLYVFTIFFVNSKYRSFKTKTLWKEKFKHWLYVCQLIYMLNRSLNKAVVVKEHYYLCRNSVLSLILSRWHWTWLERLC